MADKINDGGPAFPGQPTFGFPGGATSMSGQNGTSLRDWFAGMALTAVYLPGGRYSDAGLESCAAYAYAMADKMITARAAPASSEKEG